MMCGRRQSPTRLSACWPMRLMLKLCDEILLKNFKDECSRYVLAGARDKTDVATKLFCTNSSRSKHWLQLQNFLTLSYLRIYCTPSEIPSESCITESLRAGCC